MILPVFNFWEQLPAVLPEVGLMILALVVLAADVGLKIFGINPLPESKKDQIANIAGFGLLLIAAITVMVAASEDVQGQLYWGGMIRFDLLGVIFKFIAIVGGAFTCFMAADTREFKRKGEFYLIIVVSTLGATLLASSADLIMVFVAIETVSIPLYMLASFRKDDVRSSESGVKYFLFGSFASAIMLYGFSLLYGFSGQTNLYGIAEFFGSEVFANNPIPVLASLVMVIVGFGFKISAAPFHFWTPDVYEGAPTPVTAFVSVASKAASFAVLIRFLQAVFPATLTIGTVEIQDFWVALISTAAVLSMLIGNFVALSQKNIKRLLAYSSIAQAGYTLIGIAALQTPTTEMLPAEVHQQAIAAIAFYMLMYTFTNLLAFAAVVIFSQATGSEQISDLGGLSRRNPWVALAMTIALLSLAGIPPAAGFFGKFFLFNAAVQSGLVWLAMVGVLNSIVALYYYLVVIKVIYVNRTPDDDKEIVLTPTNAGLLGATSIAIIILGVIPQVFFAWALSGASSLLNTPL